jgi:hypothetical protein
VTGEAKTHSSLVAGTVPRESVVRVHLDILSFATRRCYFNGAIRYPDRILNNGVNDGDSRQTWSGEKTFPFDTFMQTLYRYMLFTTKPRAEQVLSVLTLILRMWECGKKVVKEQRLAMAFQKVQMQIVIDGFTTKKITWDLPS